MSKPFNYCEAEARTWKECQAAPARLRPPLPSHCDRPRPACGSEHSQRVATAAGRCGAMHHLAHNPVRPAPAGARWGWHSMAAIAPLPVRHARSALVQHGKHGQPGKVPDHAARHGCCAQPPPHRARHRTAPAQRHPLRAARRVNAPLRATDRVLAGYQHHQRSIKCAGAGSPAALSRQARTQRAPGRRAPFLRRHALEHGCVNWRVNGVHAVREVARGFNSGRHAGLRWNAVPTVQCKASLVTRAGRKQAKNDTGC